MAFGGKKPRLYKAPREGLLYAGTLDLKCLMQSTPTDNMKKVYVIDFKTGTKPKPKMGYEEWPLQTASYRNGAGFDVEGNGVVHLDKETGLPSWYDYSETYLSDILGFRMLAQFWHNRNYELLEKEDGLPSSTTILGLLDKPALLYWAVNSMRDYIVEKIQTEEIFYTKDVFGIIEEGRKNFRKVSKKAMDIGSATHEAIELWFKEGIEPPKSAPDGVITSFIAFLEWAEAHQVEPIDVEKTIYGE